MINVYPWGLSLHLVRQLRPERRKVSLLSFVRDESPIATGAGAEFDCVEREDEAVVVWMQRGVHSRA